MTRGDLKAALKLAHFSLSSECCSFDYTFDACFLSVLRGNLVTFDEVLNKLVGTISHFDGVLSSKAASSIVTAIAVIIIEVVHFGRKLSRALDLCLGLDSSGERGSWWLH